MEAILSALELNEGVNFSFALLCVFIYVITLWLVVSLWAARDATRRYGTNSYGALWFGIIFILNFPAFMFYLVVRPDDPFQDASTGGVHIPIANFVDKRDEVVLGFQVVVHSRELTDAVRDMRIDIDWESQDPAKQITAVSLEKETREVERKLQGLSALYAGLRRRLSRPAQPVETVIPGVEVKEVAKVKSEEKKVEVKSEEKKEDKKPEEKKPENKEAKKDDKKSNDKKNRN